MEELTHDMDLFAQIDDLLDFPAEDVDVTMAADLQSWPENDVFSVETGFAFSECSSEHELSIACDDIAQLEWLSNFVEESFSGNMKAECEKRNEGTNDKLCRASSPVSVVESSTGSMHDVIPLVPARARTKRPRPPSVPLHPTMTAAAAASTTTMVISPSSSTTNFSSCEFTHEDEPLPEFESAKKGGRKKMKSTERIGIAVRKCLHCESQKTPQWRMGPLGPKTLCNACGVRYKSGRLFPEYRPAASPTFMATEHSNSHKKVLEMRVRHRSVVEDNCPAGRKEMELVYQRNPIASYM